MTAFEGEMSNALRVNVASGSRLTTHFHRLILQSDVIPKFQWLASKFPPKSHNPSSILDI